ncbi:MAG: DoxX family protein [Arenicellales bacterium]|jgi:putative oxidoreductase
MITKIVALHDRIFETVQERLDSWFPGLLARLVFAAVLLVYFLNSSSKKFGHGFPGVFTVSDNAYFQILPTVVEHYSYDASQIPFFPYHIIVYLGAYSELLLPVLIVLGLFTRLASLGMIVFVFVQSYVDIFFLKAGPQAIGAYFDHLSDSTILDQRALWVFLLAFLAIRGPGRVSLDYLLHRRFNE